MSNSTSAGRQGGKKRVYIYIEINLAKKLQVHLWMSGSKGPRAVMRCPWWVISNALFLVKGHKCTVFRLLSWFSDCSMSLQPHALFRAWWLFVICFTELHNIKIISCQLKTKNYIEMLVTKKSDILFLRFYCFLKTFFNSLKLTCKVACLEK